MYNYGVDESTRRQQGVGFIVNKAHKDLISSFRGYTPRIARLSLEGKSNNCTLIQCYAPTTSHPESEVNAFYDKLQEVINEFILKSDKMLLVIIL